MKFISKKPHLATIKPATATARRPMVSVAGLRARGWTRGMVEALLGEPDKFGSNPHGGASVRLYFLDRIEVAETTDAFAAAQDAAAVRIAGAARAQRQERPRLPESPRDKPRELRLRDEIEQLAINYVRSRVRDPNSPTYGRYALRFAFAPWVLRKQDAEYAFARWSTLEDQPEYWFSLDEVEHWLSLDRDEQGWTSLPDPEHAF
jgi:hypothetical protein